MKKYIIRFILLNLTKKSLQKIWLRLLHISYYGMNIKNDGKIYASGELYILKYIRNYYNRNKESDPIVIFDVGANKGFYAEAVLETFKGDNIRLYCFEPSKIIFQNLVNRYSDNPRVELNNIGFSDTEEERNLFRSQIDSGSSSLHDFSLSHHYLGKPVEEKIKLQTCDNFIKNHNIKKVHFMKIDIEGHEYYALKGALKSINNAVIDFIQFEFGSHCVNSRVFFKDIFNLLYDNYTIYRILPDDLIEIKRYSTDLEIFATTNYLAINRFN